MGSSSEMKHLEFKEKYKELILSGKKRATVRKRANLKPGDEAFVHCGGKIIGVAKIIDVERKKIEDFSEDDAKLEGFNSLEDFLRELKNYYDDEELYFIKFDFRPFEKEVEPRELYYENYDIDKIVDEALEKLDLSEREKEILLLYKKYGSIRKVAKKLGGWKKRGEIRKVIRKAFKRLKEFDKA